MADVESCSAQTVYAAVLGGDIEEDSFAGIAGLEIKRTCARWVQGHFVAFAPPEQLKPIRLITAGAEPSINLQVVVTPTATEKDPFNTLRFFSQMLRLWHGPTWTIPFWATFPIEEGVDKDNAEYSPFEISRWPRFSVGGRPGLLSPQSLHGLQKIWVSARKLYHESETFNAALSAWDAALFLPDPRMAIMMLWSGVEALFPKINHELSYRLSLCLAVLLERATGENAWDLYNEIRDLYKIRSRVVHGGTHGDLEKAVARTVKLLGVALVEVIRRGGVASEDDLLRGVLGVQSP